MSSTDHIKRAVKDRISEVFSEDLWTDDKIITLPSDDPHVQHFLGMPEEQKILQGRIGYCFQPLIQYIAETLDDSLSFIVLMYSNQPEQRKPNVQMGKLSFCAFNNQSNLPKEQLRFRKIFRFVGSHRFSDTSIQTSKILFEKLETRESYRQYIYSFDEHDSPRPDDGLNFIPVGALSEGILESFYFKNLKSYLDKALPESIREELGKQFKRFHEDGDLERYIIARPELGREPQETNESYAILKHFNRASLNAFENLLITFNLRRSADLRRRFLNYFTWMLLCDEQIKSYSYIAAMRGNLPQGEFIIASRHPADFDLVSTVKEITGEAFSLIFENQEESQSSQEGEGITNKTVQINDYLQANDEPDTESRPATLVDERTAVHEYISSKKREQNSSDIPSRKTKAILGLDDTLLNYVGPIVTKAFTSPHKHLSLDPFWSEGKISEPDEFKPYIADLTFRTLREEFAFRYQQPASRVNPFLMAMSPVAEYLAEEMNLIREIIINGSSSKFLAHENRLLGEMPLDKKSGMLSMNIVFWDIATRQFRYCSVRFIDDDPAFDYTFNTFFRLIDTLDNANSEQTTTNRGILNTILLMSDVLFRESTREIEPACIVFQDLGPSTITSKTNIHSRFSYLSVAEFINYLNEEGTSREAFNKLYLDILNDEKVHSQHYFEEFCSDKDAAYGVWAFLKRPESQKPKGLVERTEQFLERYGLKITNRDETVARFLGYITWLWLCYRDRLAYYYYVPAQLPFNERVGGFAIATETPIPDDVLDFLFVSIVPRIVAHPALLHHREAVTQVSRAIQQCWFDSLLHLIYNTYGLKDLNLNVSTIITKLHELQQQLEPELIEQVDKIQRQLGVALQQMNKITDLEGELKRMIDEQVSPNNKLVQPWWIFNLCLRFSSIFAQKRKVTINFSEDISPNNEKLKGIQLHSPVLLVLWHTILNACTAAGELPKGADRRVHINIGVEIERQRIVFSVKNMALLAMAKRLEDADSWKGLQKDKAVLEVLWLDIFPALSQKDPLVVNVVPEGDGELVEVEVVINAPAIISQAA